MKTIVLIFLTLLPLVASSTEEICLNASIEITQKLTCFTNIEFEKLPDDPDDSNLKIFKIYIKQPMNHFHPSAGNFKQKFYLLHRDFNQPMVLSTGGYDAPKNRQSELTRLFQTNQIYLEYRYFGESKPNPTDVTFLNIRQGVEDFHKITALFKKIYQKAWIGTGGSKGGMSSIYHRKYYPGDLDGTVAYVAPNFYNPHDQRPISYINQVISPKYPGCQKKLETLQVDLLSNRLDYLPLMENKYSFHGKDVAFEHGVLYLPFRYWAIIQPDDPNFGCDQIPVNGTVKEKFEFFKRASILVWHRNSHMNRTWPYYYQVMTEVGFTGLKSDHLEHLRNHDYSIGMNIPKIFQPIIPFSTKISKEMAKWVKDDASDLILIYGENDPMSAAAFEINNNTSVGRRVLKLVNPNGNHLSNIDGLPSPLKKKAIDLIKKWIEQ